MAIIEPYPRTYKVGVHNGKKAFMVLERYVTSERYRGEEDETGFWLIPDPDGPLTHFGIASGSGKRYRYRMFRLPVTGFEVGDAYTRRVVDGKIRFEKVYD